MNRFIALQKVVELGSISKAAQAMGYTQSAVSQMLMSLENEISIKLVNRSRTGVKLTVEGAELYPYIERFANQYSAIQEKINEIKSLELGIVRMGTLASISVQWLPSLLKEFQSRYPGVEFVIHQGDYESIQQWIKNGTIDFGFVTPPAVDGIQTIPLKEGEMLAVLPEHHRLASYEVVPLQELQKEPFILLEEGNYYEPLEAFRKLGIEPDVKYILHDDYAIMAMVEAGLGVSIMAKLILDRRSYRLALRPTDPPVTRHLAIGYKDVSALPMAAKRFLDLLISHLDRLP